MSNVGRNISTEKGVIMNQSYLPDSHCHSEHSFDGNDPVRALCEHAAGLGLYSLTVTDHCECNEYEQTNARESILRSVEQTGQAAAESAGRLRVYRGVELGQATQNPAAAQEILGLCPFDFVLGSLHNLRGKPDFYFLDYRTEDVPRLLHTYFDELLELIEQGWFDSLAHLTYPLRYIVGDHRIAVNADAYQQRVDEVLCALVQHEKALEVNTSGLRQKIGETLPGESIVRRFRQLGGKYVTLGSDAHRAADVGSGIAQGLALLQRAGFSHVTVFVNRSPALLPLDASKPISTEREEYAP